MAFELRFDKNKKAFTILSEDFEYTNSVRDEIINMLSNLKYLNNIINYFL